MKIFSLLILLSFSDPKPLQEIRNGSEVIKLLDIELKSRKSISAYTFRSYSEACQELVRRGNYDLADSLFSISQSYIKYETDSNRIMRHKSSRGFMLKVRGRYEESLKEYFAVRDYYTRKRDIDQTCLINAYLAEFYRAQSDKEQCEKYVYEGLAYIKNHDIAPGIKAYLYSRMASFQSEYKSDRDSTILYANLALENAELSGENYSAALSQNELGFIYMNIDPKDTVKTFNYYDAALDNFLKENRYRDYISVLDNKARNYLILGLSEKAIALLEIAIPIAEANNWTGFLDDSYFLMATSLAGIGDTERSRRYYELAYNTKIYTLQAQHALEVSNLTSTYERNAAEQELEEAKLEAEKNRNALTIAILITAFSFVIAATGLLLFNRFRKKNNTLKEQQEIIAKTNRDLNEALDEKEVLYKEVNHRVKNNLMVLSGLVFLQESSQSDDVSKQSMATLRNRIQAMAMVHEKLYSITSAKEIAFQPYLEELVPALIEGLSRKDTDVKLNIECEDLTLPIDEAVPVALIFNEWITNSLKYAVVENESLRIQIKGQKRTNGFSIYYDDNGPGIDENKPLSNLSMGLKLIELLTKQLNGTLNRTTSSKGVRFEIKA